MDLSEQVTLDSSGPNLSDSSSGTHGRLLSAAPLPWTQSQRYCWPSPRRTAREGPGGGDGAGAGPSLVPISRVFDTSWALLEEVAVRRVEFAEGFGSVGVFLLQFGSRCSANPFNAKS